MSEMQMNQTEKILLDMYASDDRATFGFAERLEQSIATEYHRTPSLPDVMEDGDEVWRVGAAFIRVEIHNGEFPAYEFTNDHGRRPLTITSELAEFLGLPTLKLQNNQIMKVDGR